MLGALQKFTLSILVFAVMLILGSCSDKDQVNSPSAPKYLIGDINNNGIAYDVADVVLFINYFIYGLGVFTIDQEIQIATTDINKDGLTLSVADLTYMIRKGIGDAQPIITLDPVDAIYRINVKGTIEVDIEIGAAALQLQGIVEPTLLAGNMDMESAFDAANNVTRVLVYNLNDIGQTFTGEFLSTNGSKLVRIEMATYEGQPVIANLQEMQLEFVLSQNEPNPFDSITVIQFAFPRTVEASFIITDDGGQAVFKLHKRYGAGVSSIIWEGKNYFGQQLPNGIYNYSLIVEGQKKTREMILLK